MRSIAGTVLFAALSGLVFSQSTPSTTAPAEAAAGTPASAPAPAAATTPVKFEIADIHPSPPLRYPFFEGAFLEDGRYIVRQATMADLISTAYSLKDSSYVDGGPSWLEWNRWDVIAKVPPGTTEATAKQMLQSLLKDRFNLVAHNGSGPVPSYVLTLENDKPTSNLKPSSGAEDAACKGEPPPPGPPPPGTIVPALLHCHNMTMEKFAQVLPGFAFAYLQKPMADRTGLKGAYDFDVHWTSRVDLARAGTDGITVFDALDKQLGLKLTLGTANEPVFLVDSVNETPTPNAPDLAKIMPPLPPAQFEVATIKPSTSNERQNGRISGDEVNVHGFPLKFLIVIAWDLDPNDNGELVGAPKWVDTDKIDVEAKVASENMVEGAPRGPGDRRPTISFDDLREMLKALLIERFEMKVHMDDQIVDAYDLVAVKPKLTRADPNIRTNCHPGPGPDGNDPRLTHPILNMLVTCQNMTMAEAVKQFPTFAAYYLYYPPVDKTGLKGGWNFTLSWSSGDNMPGFNGGGGPPQSQNETAVDPNGAVSFYDAVNKELGLKLVKVKRREPVLVIDHIDEQPIPN